MQYQQAALQEKVAKHEQKTVKDKAPSKLEKKE